jgi:ankyrin repeat protein
LHYAASEGDADIAEALIAAGADLNAETLTVDSLGDCKMTALSYAAWLNKARVVTLLIAAKADFECDGSIPGLSRKGMKPIHMASRKGSKKEPTIDSVHALILAKACVTCQDDSGSTPLMYAAQGGDESVIKMLLDANASLNINVAKMTIGGGTALHEAAAKGANTKVVNTC